jgi:glycosyltransferase involved in cell wall biosynthesis
VGRNVRILHTVEFYEPSVGGAQEVVRRLSEHLVRRGHEVTVATSKDGRRNFGELNGVLIEQFDVRGNAVRGLEGDVQGYRDFLRSGRFDVMLNYAAQQWATDASLEILDELPYAAVLAPCGFSGLYQRPYRRYYSELPLFLARYDALVFHGSHYRDIEFARSHGLERLDVIWNGVDVAEFDVVRSGFRKRYGIAPDAPMILTVGSHTGLKGHDRLAQAFRRLPLEGATLVVLGNVVRDGCARSCRRRAMLQRIIAPSKRTIVESVPRDVVLEALFDATIFALPSRIECAPAVLYEACAAGTPFVASAVGNAAEIADKTGGGCVVPTHFDEDGYADVSAGILSDVLSDLLRDSARLQAMGSAGRDAWRRSFTWDHIAERYEDLYRDAIARRGER